MSKTKPKTQSPELPVPANIDAEKLILGAALADHEAWPQIAELLQPDSFSTQAHRLIFSAIASVYENGKQIDVPAVAQQLMETGMREAAGGVGYLVDLPPSLSLQNIPSFCEVITKCAARRSVIDHAQRLIQQCAFGEEVSAEYLERIQQTLEPKQNRSAARKFEEIVHDAGGMEAFLSSPSAKGIPLPFLGLHEALDGLRPQCLTILGARPGVGKTAIAMQIAQFSAQSGYHVVFVSLEMGAKRLIHRSLAGAADIPNKAFRRGDLTANQHRSLRHEVDAMASLDDRLRFIDEPGLTIQGLEARLRFLNARGRVALCVVDYLQLLQIGGNYENRVQEVSAISRRLKRLTLRYEMNILALSQLSRQKGDATQEPDLNWLKESGQLEQDADQVVFLWPKREKDEGDTKDVFWSVKKNRDGALDRGTLIFEPRRSRFVEDAIPGLVVA